jgi:ABC-type multidrug transport system fused ATPase/permease subunit
MTLRSLILRLRSILKGLDSNLRLWFLFSSVVRVLLVGLDLLGLMFVGVVTSLMANTQIAKGTVVANLMELSYTLGFSNPIYAFATGAVAFFLLKALAGASDSLRTSRHLAKIEAEASAKALDSMFRRGLAGFEAMNRQQAIQGLTSSMNNLYSQTLGSSLSVVAEISVILLIAIALLVVSPVLFSLLALVLVIVFLSLQKFVLKKSSFEATQAHTFSLSAQQLLDETLRALRPTIAMGHSNRVVSAFLSKREAATQHNATYMFLQSIPRYAVELSVIFCVATIGLLQAILGPQVIPAVSVGIFMAGLFRLMSAMVPLQGSLGNLARSIPEAKLANQIESAGKLGNELTAPKAFATPAEAKEQASVGVKFDGVYFRYSNDSARILNNVNFTVNFGELVQISGASGQGKSTLVDLLLGLRSPTAGKVSIGGLEPSRFDSKAYVPQDSTLMSGSMRDNIIFMNSRFTGSELERQLARVIELAELQDVVAKLPDGLETIIGEDGAALSGGEIQRVGIARALFGNPKVIVFDEATSALDIRAAQAIGSVINGLQGLATVFVITHGSVSAYKFDREIQVKTGEVTSLNKTMGNHE